MAAVVYHAAETKQDLYDRITGNGEAMLLLGNTTKGDSPATLWTYDTSSSASDNFAGGVIQPTLQTGNGRWIKQNNFPLVPTIKRQETYSGTTDGSGNYTVTFGTSYSVAPNIQPSIIGGSDTQFYRITSITTIGFTVNIRNRTDVLGLLPSYSNVSGASVDVLITEK